jgi:hypothetical protein
MDVQSSLETDLIDYDEDLKSIINIYLTFITDWVHDLVQNKDLSKALWVLNDEWKFCKNNLFFVTASEDIFGKRFCTMSGFLNSSLLEPLNYIDTEYKQKLMEYNHDLEFSEEDDDTDVDNKQQQDLIYDEDGTDLETDDRNQYKQRVVGSSSGNEFISDINIKCNEFKEEVNRLRKISMKSLKFCSKLISDLELAAKYEVTSNMQELLNHLKSINYVLVQFTNPELADYKLSSNSSGSDSSFMLFIPQEFSKDKIQIIRLLFIISEKDDYDSLNDNNSNNNNNMTNNQKEEEKNKNENHLQANNIRRLSSSNSFYDTNNFLNKLSKMAHINETTTPSPHHNNNSSSNTSSGNNNNNNQHAFLINNNSNTDGCLLYLHIPNTAKNQLFAWPGQKVNLFASTPVRLALYQHRSAILSDSDDVLQNPTLILVTPKQSVLLAKRAELQTKLQGCIKLLKEKTSFHPNIESALDELKDSILRLRNETSQFINLIEKDLKGSKYNMMAIDQRYLNEIWRVCYTFGIELHNDCIKFMTRDRAEEFTLGLAEFSIMWCEYIVNRTERGKGTTGKYFYYLDSVSLKTRYRGLVVTSWLTNFETFFSST